ncbi:5656_t:CDS:2, partial [Racocetra persica]
SMVVQTGNRLSGLKRKAHHGPRLAYPNFSQEFLLFTDASGIALGAILSQRDLQERKREYTFTVIHCARKSHSNADSLSRIAESSTTTPADF